MIEKRAHPAFCQDIAPLLIPDVSWHPDEAFRMILDRLIALLPGKPWKGAPQGKEKQEED